MRKLKGLYRFLKAVSYIFWYSSQGIIYGIFGDGNAYFRKRLAPSAEYLLKITGVTFSLEGTEHLNPDENYLFLGNHRSYTDIVALFVAAGRVNRQISFMSKKEIFYMPLLGKPMKAMGMIGVERGKSSKAMRSLLEAVKLLKNGVNLVIFPEGTRSRDGHTLSPFKKGSFTIASRAKVNIAPFVIEGTEIYMPKGEFAMYPADVKIRFLPTIKTEGKKETELMEETEKAIKEALCQ
ncbi:MAG: 1-acyl-sn-glycerol-3-phosphate acyltransferase [Mucispirillum sp.]|nr:1-acyl-sn-glycerol-3-phosphate acyltransferase [Mucispirillum sp.]